MRNAPRRGLEVLLHGHPVAVPVAYTLGGVEIPLPVALANTTTKQSENGVQSRFGRYRGPISVSDFSFGDNGCVALLVVVDLCNQVSV